MHREREKIKEIEEIEEDSTEIENQKEQERRMKQARIAPGRLVCTMCTGVEWLSMAKERVNRPINRLYDGCSLLMPVDWAGRPRHGPFDRQKRFC